MKTSAPILRLLTGLAFLTITACQKDESLFVADPPSIGQVEIPGVVLVTFPKGSVATTEATLEKVSGPARDAVFNLTGPLFQVGQKLPYDIVLNIGKNPPINDEIKVVLTLPTAFKGAMPPGEGVELFAQIYQDGGEEILDNFDIIPSSYDPLTSTVVAYLPTSVFSQKRKPDKSYEVILTLGTTPGENLPFKARSLPDELVAPFNMLRGLAASTCKANSIVCPLGTTPGCGDGILSSPFLPQRTINGKTKPHKGVDFKIPVNTSVNAITKGKIVLIDYHPEGWGKFVVVRHDDGSASLYGHLSSVSVKMGEAVDTSKELGKSGNTGRSTGPHLHLEYIPNGNIAQDKARVDPMPCMGTGIVEGSINVRDNGNIADDAFAVYLDKILIGTTEIGKANSIALSNIRPGDRMLKIKCVFAPDNIGTFGVSLNDGITFQPSGATQISSTLSQGGEIAYPINIPTKTKRDALVGIGSASRNIIRSNAHVEQAIK